MKDKYEDELDEELSEKKDKKINRVFYICSFVFCIILFILITAILTVGIEKKQKDMYTNSSNNLEFVSTESTEVDILPTLSDRPLWQFVCSIRDELYEVGVTDEHLIQSSIRSIEDRLYYSFVFTISDEENKYVNLQIWMDNQNNVKSYMISNSEDEFNVSD